MSRRTLRGAIPTVNGEGDSVGASAVDGSGQNPAEPIRSGASVFRPPPGEQADAGTVATRPGGASVDPENILLRGEDAARARRIDLVGNAERDDLAAVGPWAEQIDDAREAARAAGFQQGRQEGLAAGLQAAKGKVDQRCVDLGLAIDTAVAGLDARAGDVGQQLAARVAELALEIAGAVLDREVATADDPGAEAIARCLDLVPDSGCLNVRLHPDDAAGLGEVPGADERELTVTPDPDLAPGDAIVSVDQITIDARLSESLRRVEDALR